LKNEMEHSEEVGVEGSDVHGRDDDYHYSSLVLSFRRHQSHPVMRSAPFVLLLASACVHGPDGGSRTAQVATTLPGVAERGPGASEVVARAAAVSEARGTWIASTVRFAQTRAMRGDLESARTLLAAALERAEADGDVAGKSRLQAELAVVLAD